MEYGPGGEAAVAHRAVAECPPAGARTSRGHVEDCPVLGSCLADQPARGAGWIGQSPTSPRRHGLRSHTEMLDQFTTLEDGDLALPTSSLDLSTRMRDLRARQGLKQSEVARRMGLDPSIPSLWEQGKRLVPANRVRPLADALEVSIEELLDGVSGAQRQTPSPSAVARTLPDTTSRGVVAELVDQSTIRPQPADAGPLLRMMPPVEDEPDAQLEPSVVDAAATEQWVVPERPPLDGWIPDGWQPTDRIQDITPSLPDGYWLDPVKLERVPARQLLRSRLCVADQT